MYNANVLNLSLFLGIQGCSMYNANVLKLSLFLGILMRRFLKRTVTWPYD